MAGWLHGVVVGDWLFVFPLCGFSLSLLCNYFKSLYNRMTLQHHLVPADTDGSGHRSHRPTQCPRYHVCGQGRGEGRRFGWEVGGWEVGGSEGVDAVSGCRCAETRH